MAAKRAQKVTPATEVIDLYQPAEPSSLPPIELLGAHLKDDSQERVDIAEDLWRLQELRTDESLLMYTVSVVPLRHPIRRQDHLCVR